MRLRNHEIEKIRQASNENFEVIAKVLRSKGVTITLPSLAPRVGTAVTVTTATGQHNLLAEYELQQQHTTAAVTATKAAVRIQEYKHRLLLIFVCSADYLVPRNKVIEYLWAELTHKLQDATYVPLRRLALFCTLDRLRRICQQLRKDGVVIPNNPLKHSNPPELSFDKLTPGDVEMYEQWWRTLHRPKTSLLKPRS